MSVYTHRRFKERSFSRLEYLQKTAVQKACLLLEWGGARIPLLQDVLDELRADVAPGRAVWMEVGPWSLLDSRLKLAWAPTDFQETLTWSPPPAGRGCSRAPGFSSSAVWFPCRYSGRSWSPAAARDWSLQLCPQTPAVTRTFQWRQLIIVSGSPSADGGRRVCGPFGRWRASSRQTRQS